MTRGGPIVLVQIENEAGGGRGMLNYMAKLRDFARNAGFDIPLFTADQASGLRTRSLADTFQAVNFSSRAPEAFAKLAKVQPDGPRFSGENYTGWFSSWGQANRPGLGNLQPAAARDESDAIEVRETGSERPSVLPRAVQVDTAWRHVPGPEPVAERGGMGERAQPRALLESRPAADTLPPD